ncbi:MAG: methionyl-tRNA formyltransferase [Chthoniobacteraceae bacterium]|nr:methionyl-tRNA formyltransferase [Chthoniobacteraceae bacterium]
MRVLFLGTGDIGLPALEWLLRHHEVAAVVTQPDKPVGRKQTLTPPPTKCLALAHGVPVLQPRRIREPASVAELAAFAPEVLVVMAYGQILPKAVLDLPTLACLNLHASLLPAHRGAAPIQAAILAGERETGVAVMWMDEGLDTGDVLLARSLPIRRRETGGTLHDRLATLAPEALAEALDLLAQGASPRTPQQADGATYAPKLSRESGVIDWHAPAREIDRRVRAMNPWPAASTRLPDPAGGPSRVLKVFSVISFRHAGGEPGTVLRADKRGILVAAGEGAVLLRDVQLEGKRRMHVRDFLSGHHIAAGTRLG